MDEYRLERLSDENADLWERFNHRSAYGSLFHSLKWIGFAAQHSEARWHNYILFRDDDVAGIFPLAERQIRYFRGLAPAHDPQRLSAVLEEPLDPRAMHETIGGLQRLEKQGKNRSFVCFSMARKAALDSITEYPLFPDADEGDMVLDLKESPPEKVWNAFSAKSGQRKYIRRFDDDGFEATEITSPEDLQRFYEHYKSNINHIGAVPRPFSYFAGLLDSMADESRITMLAKGPLMAGGLLTLADRPRKTAYFSYLSLNRELPNHYTPASYVYWEGINWAWRENFEKVSFGMQREEKDNPRFRLKNYFGTRFEPRYFTMIPLTRTFTMGLGWAQWRAGRQGPESP